jgi:predicted HAD superfamily Cof-like phosphohydrolase
MRIQLNQVKKWCEATDIEIAEKPKNLLPERAHLRFNLMAEENTEYLEACTAGDTRGYVVYPPRNNARTWHARSYGKSIHRNS